MPDAHPPRDENPRRKLAPHRLGKHPVLHECKPTAEMWQWPCTPASPASTTLAGEISVRQANLWDAGGAGNATQLWAGGNRAAGISGRYQRSLRLCGELIFTCRPRNLRDLPQNRTERRENGGSRESRLSSHCLTLPHPNSTHPARPLQTGCGEPRIQNSMYRSVRSAAWR